MKTPSEQAQKTLTVLQQAVAEALEKKRKLGQYAVVWRDGKVVRLMPESDTNEEGYVSSR